MRQSRGRRLARGTTAASIATFAALVSHVAVGGAAPTLVGVAVPLVLSIAVCVLLAGRRLSLPRLAIAVAVSQSMFHVLFVLGATRSTMPTTPGHDHSAMLGVMLAPSSVEPAALVGGAMMWAGHAIAAVVTTAAIHRGERAVTAGVAIIAGISAWFRRRLSFLFASFTRPRATERVRGARDVAPTRPSVPLRIARRRGPPALVAV